MSIVLHAVSGSPGSWKVWLTLEHKKIPYRIEFLSYDAGDNQKPAFLALNPRGQVPVLVDGNFILSESGAIVEYLEEKWPEPRLLRGDARERARIRQLALDAHFYFETAFRKIQPSANERIPAADRVRKLVDELALIERELTGDFRAGGQVTLADFTLYPMLALMRRLADRFEIKQLTQAIGPRTAGWMKRIETLPYFDRTYPPHWRT